MKILTNFSMLKNTIGFGGKLWIWKKIYANHRCDRGLISQTHKE